MNNKPMFFSQEIHDLYERSKVPMGICYVENGRFQVHIVSDGVCKMYRSTREEMFERLNGPDPFVNIVEKEEMLKAVRAFSVDDEPYDVVFHEYVGAQKKLITVHCTGFHEYTEDGRRYSILLYDEVSDKVRRNLFQDEEKKIAERDLLFSKMDDAIARSYTSVIYIDTSDLTTHIVRLNRFGRQVEARLGKEITLRPVMDAYVKSLVYQDDAPGVLRFGDYDYVMARLKENNPLFHTYRTIRDGKIVYYRLKIIPLDDGKKLVYGFEHFDSQMREKLEREEERETQMTLLAGLSCEYEAVWLVDAGIHYGKLIRNNMGNTKSSIVMNMMKEGNYEIILENYIEQYVVPEDRERMYTETSIDSLLRNAREDELYHVHYSRVNEEGEKNYMQLVFSRVTDDLGVTRFVCGFRNIDEVVAEEKKKSILYSMAHIDNMTSLGNRRTFDEYMDSHLNKEPEADLIFFSFDLNELKSVNDTCGHEAGDELIVGAADCMRNVFGPSGRLFRTGGDEFAAIVNCDSDLREKLVNELTDSFHQWRGKTCSALSISMGYVCSDEKPGVSLEWMRREAEKRMYSQKSDYYRQEGKDRRGRHW
ncbi:MAG: GGDEF domain-containing protein [Lachnospiraceae bacterium]|nr:GGDEF domain-containing protein [Lachnospiraceae bacterium]